MHALAPTVEYGWSTRDPIATVGSGTELDLEFRDASDGQVRRASTVEVLDTYENGRGNPITGPIVVEGAQPGDVLQVDILDFEVDTWGWTCFVPGFGLLTEDFPKPGLLHWDVRDGFAHALGLKVPTAPFPGVVGVCPAGPGQPFSVVPPRSGRRQRRHPPARRGLDRLPPDRGRGGVVRRRRRPRTAGRRRGLRLGDRDRVARPPPAHAPARHATDEPGLREPARPQAASRIFATTGVEPDLMRGAQNAVRRMIEWLSARYRITPEEAYLLSSVVVDLRISEVVDPPNWVVSACFPLDLVTPACDFAPSAVVNRRK